MNPSTKENLGLPIHPFDNNISFDVGGPAKNRREINNPNRLICSPIKKTSYSSSSSLTNKYLNIRQEESELSDAESLASLDPLDDIQIEQLMKDASIQKAADDIMQHPPKEILLVSEGDL